MLRFSTNSIVLAKELSVIAGVCAFVGLLCLMGGANIAFLSGVLKKVVGAA